MRPPVFVMNPYYSGLGIARSLRSSGVAVYALTSERDTPGTRSRCFRGVFEVPNGRDEPERLRDRLIELSRAVPKPPILFPTRDFDVLFLHEYRDALAPGYVLPQPAGSSILRIMDKLELARIAEEQGIRVPATLVCRSAAELERELPGLRFPVILKPRFAYQWRRSGLWEKVGGVKAIIVESADELRAQYHRLSAFQPEVLLQRYVSGHDDDIVVCGCYVNRDGQLLGYFTGRKIRQNPPLVGTGSVVEATDVPTIAGSSLRLLKAFGYSGIAEVEFKFDRAAQAYFLIEVNPRHWDQHELGLLVGVNLTHVAYSDLVGVPPVTVSPVYRPGRKYIWVAERELTYAAAREFRNQMRASLAVKGLPRAILGAALNTIRDLRNVLRGQKILGILRVRDPRPGIAMCWGLLVEGFRVMRLAWRPSPHDGRWTRHIGKSDERS
jgi:D-aspartate ligase